MDTDESQPITKCMYVDLSNLYGGISGLFAPGVYIDFSTLMPLLQEQFEGIDKFKVYGAYMGYDTADNYKMQRARAQNEFFNSAKLPDVHFGKGRISKYGQEKSVDMQLGVDMVHDAHRGLYTDYILFSGDADLQYPVSIIKMLGKTFHYCAFANRFALSFAFEAKRKIVIDYNRTFRRQHFDSGAKLPRNLEVYDMYKHADDKLKSVIIKAK